MKRFISYSRLLSVLVASWGIMSLSSCDDESFVPDRVDGFGRLTLTAQSGDMLEPFSMPEVMSRAGDPKNEAEKKINKLHLFFFDGATGKLLDSKYENFRPYQVLDNFMFVVKDEAYREMGNVTIVAVANINGTDDDKMNRFSVQYDYNGTTITDEGWIGNGVRINSAEEYTSNMFVVRTLDDLKNWVYAPKLRTEEGTDITQLPKAGMPMIGMLEKQNLAAMMNAQKSLVIPMTAMMSRVDIRVSLDPNQESTDGRLPQLTIKEYGVKNMPTTVPFTMPSGGTATNVIGDGKLEQEVKVTLDEPIVINKNTNNQVPFTYYTYENIQYPDKSALRSDGTPAYKDGLLTYPTGVDPNDESQTQRWKPTIAYKDRASAMVLRGSYITHQGMTYEAQFTVYMGQNTYDNFEVKRNHKYNNNITIHGLDYVRNSDDDAYTFDGRVNVKTDNPIYLAIVNERKVDAHASVRPMDVWFLLREPDKAGGQLKEVDWYSEVEVTVDDACDWVRMELVPRSAMEAGGFQAGTGARDYFTTDLVTNTLANTGKSITIKAQPGADGATNFNENNQQSRSRIYFYIDENVRPVNTNGDIPDRIAKINVRYRRYDREGGTLLDERVRVLEIEQRGLQKITVSHSSASGDGKLTDTYMEYYEEYLEHSDPLDKHQMPGALYEGMPWGIQGINYGNAGGRNNYRGDPTPGILGILSYEDFSCVYDYGLQATQWVLFSRIGQNGYTPMSTVKLYNAMPPVTAFHYCYGKNKRNADGSVPAPSGNSYENTSNGGWYLPGIRELERALTQYYTTFPDFNGNFYWSASCAKSDTRNNSRARATKVIIDGITVDYAKSDANDTYTGSSGTKGCALRTEILRVRAFYRLPSNWRNNLNQ